MSTGTSLTPSDRGLVLLGHEGSPRTRMFAEAAARLGFAPPRLIEWKRYLRGEARLRDVIREGSIVRIESPGRCFETERLLLERGARAAGTGPDAGVLAALPFDRGLILHPELWYRGLCEAMGDIVHDLAASADHHGMNHPHDILVMFDKTRCAELLRARGVLVPPAVAAVRGFEELRERMRASGLRQVFLKLRHGSSASGALAYRTDGVRHQARTTVELVEGSGGPRLYNTRKVKHLDDVRRIARLVDALAVHEIHVEPWIPKASVRGLTCDVRVVGIRGVPRHRVLRLSRSPMTNLHLLNDRADVSLLTDRLADGVWESALESCRRALAVFPRSLHAGLDLLVTSDFRSHCILEVNAFGDLLPGVLDRGMNTYAAELVAIREATSRGASVVAEVAP